MAAPTPSPEVRAYIINDILPINEVHLIAGSSGSGKTTLAWQIIEAIKLGKPIFDHPTFPQNMAYIACDRKLQSIIDTKHRAGITVDIPTWSAVSHNISRDYQAISTFAKQHVPDLQLLWIDGFSRLCPKGDINDYQTVSDFLVGVTRGCTNGFTIIGLAHDAKQRKGHEYTMARERIIGSAAWGGFSDTIIHIAHTDPENTADTRRTINLLPRNAPDEILTYSMSSGRLLPADLTQESVEVFLLWEAIKAKQQLMWRTGEILEVAATIKVPMRTAERYIVKLIDEGKMESVRKGMYKIAAVN